MPAYASICDLRLCGSANSETEIYDVKKRDDEAIRKRAETCIELLFLTEQNIWVTVLWSPLFWALFFLYSYCVLAICKLSWLGPSQSWTDPYSFSVSQPDKEKTKCDFYLFLLIFGQSKSLIILPQQSHLG